MKGKGVDKNKCQSVENDLEAKDHFSLSKKLYEILCVIKVDEGINVLLI